MMLPIMQFDLGINKNPGMPVYDSRSLLKLCELLVDYKSPTERRRTFERVSSRHWAVGSVKIEDINITETIENAKALLKTDRSNPLCVEQAFNAV